MSGKVADISISVELAEALDRLDGGFARRDYLATLHLLRLGVPLIANDGESGLSLGSLCRFVIASDPMFDDSPWVYGDPSIETLAHLIMTQARELGDAATAMRRRQARRQQLFAALPTDDGPAS